MISAGIGQDDWRALFGGALGDLLPHLTLEKVRVNQRATQVLVCFLSDTLVGEKDFLAMKGAISQAFPAAKVSLRVACPALADDFAAHTDRYAAFLSDCVRRHCPIAQPWLDQAVWRVEGKELLLEAPTDTCRRYFEDGETLERVRRVLREVFRLELPVRVTLAEDHASQMEAMMQARRREEEAIEASFAQQPQTAPDKNGAQKKGPILGRAIAGPPVDIGELTEESGRVIVRGEVIAAETRQIKGGDRVLLIFALTDYTGTIQCKAFLRYKNAYRKGEAQAQTQEPTEQERRAVQAVIDAVKAGACLCVRGDCRYDTFAKGINLMVGDISAAEKPQRRDEAPSKRVELHMHTQMSSMDGVSSAKALIAQAAAWGHPAVAVTDHGVLQAFPDAFAAAAEHHIKLIPGLEAYLVDEGTLVDHPTDRDLRQPIVVLDFETTGLSARKDRIIEVGAVRLIDGQVTEEFSIMVNPGVSIPPRITQITGITDIMVQDARAAAQVLPELLAFIGDAPIAAHNAAFDASFLREECRRAGAHCAPAVIDTLEFARRLYPQMKSHRLAALCKHLGITNKNAHRAVHDARATALALTHMLNAARDRGARTLSDLSATMSWGAIGEARHAILLATSQQGMVNLNRLVSEAHLRYFRKRPHIPRSLLQAHREGILVGSACEAGEVFRAVLNGEPAETLLRVAKFYDYLEIQPTANNAFLVREGQVADEEGLRALNRRIADLADELGIPVVATGDVHFLQPQDAAFRAVLMAGQGYRDADEQPPLYLRTTEEMLAEFAYLGPHRCRAAVVDNPQAIAEKVGELCLFPKHPEGRDTFQPYWPDAADNIRMTATDTARARYGDVLPPVVEARLKKELDAIIGYGFATLYNIAEKLVKKSMADGYLVGSRGSVGSSFVATMCGITEVNPLPPHYRCPNCRHSVFDVDAVRYKVGVDLPPMDCPCCGTAMEREGCDIPFEVFLGFKGDKVPDIDLNFSGVYQPKAHKYVEELFGADYCFRAGTISALKDKTAYGYVSKYCEERGLGPTEAEKNRLAQGCVGVKRTTGQHPGGIVVLPKDYEIYQFTAVQHPADDPDSGIVTTHYDFRSMHDVLVKLDILGHDDPTMLRLLEDMTGVSPLSLPLTDAGVLSLFSSPDALGVDAQTLRCGSGTLGIPEFGTRFVRQMLEDTQPTTMEELIRISGLSHGTDVWLGNAQEIIRQGLAPLSQCICTRDDIMNALIVYGLEPKAAFDIMENVRKGKGLREEMQRDMRAHGVPDWFIDSCQKIKYMFPRGHAVAYVTMALRVAWYKLYRPDAYYAAYFSARGVGFDARVMLGDVPALRAKLETYEAQGKQVSAKDADQVTMLELAVEMNLRGIRFVPVDLYKSDEAAFRSLRPGALLPPLTALPGLGESVAQSIVSARQASPFLSAEDIKARTKASAANIDMLRELGCLKDIPDTSQVSLFSML
ncbi:MAG: PolC-type DNA polymerase III [Oscillospiraceae bacterium]|jgi:DNA polymerase-3 subunit alpha (Gram-positive type)|nr:PolC-type DNA polymerase III [Oscillospiraceae bacterium]